MILRIFLIFFYIDLPHKMLEYKQFMKTLSGLSHI